MLLSSPGSQLHLLLTLLKASLSGRCEVFITTRARHTFLIVLRCLVCLSDGMAAGVTLFKTAFFKPVIHRNARIKNEAFAFPSRF